MKPTFQITDTTNRRDANVRHSPRSASPKIEQHFRPNSHADYAGRCHGSPAPSFRRISDDYFNNEARGQFVSEAAVFGLMIVAAAVPMIQGVNGALNYLRAVGIL